MQIAQHRTWHSENTQSPSIAIIIWKHQEGRRTYQIYTVFHTKQIYLLIYQSQRIYLYEGKLAHDLVGTDSHQNNVQLQKHDTKLKQTSDTGLKGVALRQQFTSYVDSNQLVKCQKSDHSQVLYLFSVPEGMVTSRAPGHESVIHVVTAALTVHIRGISPGMNQACSFPVQFHMGYDYLWSNRRYFFFLG